MKKISNPLTIIGLFAGIAEVAGTVVLPFVSLELQKFFIWYVMGFPILLVVLFFITLNKNPKVLYAPSDFTDEKNFMELINAASINVTNVIEKNPSVENELKPVETLIEKLAIEKDSVGKADIFNNSSVDVNNLDCKGFLIHDDKKFKLSEYFIIGRGKNADLIINDPSVSRLHCEIRFIDGKYFIKDYNTSNGIKINGKRIDGDSYIKLEDNSIINIGKVEFVFKYYDMMK